MKKLSIYVLALVTVLLGALVFVQTVEATTYIPYGELYLDKTTVPKGKIVVGQSGQIRPLQDSPLKDFQYAYSYQVRGTSPTGLEVTETGQWKATGVGKVRLEVWYGHPSEQFLAEMKKYDLSYRGDYLPTISSYEIFDMEIIPEKSPVYRLYNAGLKVHLYTSDKNEYDVLAGRGWTQEGQSWTTSNLSGQPVYRLYHEGLKVHLYTMDTNEYNVLAGRGWRKEGLAYRSSGTKPVYRLYHAGIQKHLYTRDSNEKNVLSTRGWRYEGVAWNVE